MANRAIAKAYHQSKFDTVKIATQYYLQQKYTQYSQVMHAENVKMSFQQLDGIMYYGWAVYNRTYNFGIDMSRSNFKSEIAKLIIHSSSFSLDVKLLSGECHWTSLLRSQQWLSQWFGAIRQRAFTWINVDSDWCRNVAALGHGHNIGITLHWFCLCLLMFFSYKPRRSDVCVICATGILGTQTFTKLFPV